MDGEFLVEVSFVMNDDEWRSALDYDEPNAWQNRYRRWSLEWTVRLGDQRNWLPDGRVVRETAK